MRHSPYIKVDVTFEPIGAPEDELAESPEDKITRISKPFLEGPIIDAIGSSESDATDSTSRGGGKTVPKLPWSELPDPGEASRALAKLPAPGETDAAPGACTMV